MCRPPSGGPESVTATAGLLRSVKEKSVLIGDFNLTDIKWEEGTARGRLREVLEAADDGMIEKLVHFSIHMYKR